MHVTIIIVLLVILILLLIVEYLWRIKNLPLLTDRENSFILQSGSFVAFWPYFLHWDQIDLLALGFLGCNCHFPAGYNF